MAEEQKQQKEEEEEEEVGEEESEEEEEDSHPPPSKVARVSSAAADPSASGAMAVYDAPAPAVLGLDLVAGGAAEPSSFAVKPSFTFMQRQELHHHLRIFDYIVRRAPVPLDLVLPIWKSVAASFGPHHYPSFVGLGNLCYDFRNSMEPEPGRCRRTDGKKWRCSRDVIPNEKYCERHMHRGRVRSRKPVEAASEASADATATVSPAAAAAAANAVPIGSGHPADAHASAADPPATSVS